MVVASKEYSELFPSDASTSALRAAEAAVAQAKQQVDQATLAVTNAELALKNDEEIHADEVKEAAARVLSEVIPDENYGKYRLSIHRICTQECRKLSSQIDYDFDSYTALNAVVGTDLGYVEVAERPATNNRVLCNSNAGFVDARARSWYDSYTDPTKFTPTDGSNYAPNSYYSKEEN